MEHHEKHYEKLRKEINMERWGDILATIPDEHTKVVVGIVLENQRLINEHTPYNGSEEFLDIIANVVPNLLAHNLVSVQPALGPASLVFQSNLKFRTVGDKVETYKEYDCETVLAKTRMINFETNYELKQNLDKEILEDLWNNVGTTSKYQDELEDPVINADVHRLYNAIIEISGIIHRKTLTSFHEGNYWIVMNSKTYEKQNKDVNYYTKSTGKLQWKLFDCFKHGRYKLYISDALKHDGILMGWKGNEWFDSAYQWCPYVFLTKCENRYLTRYGKRLRVNGSKFYGKIEIV